MKNNENDYIKYSNVFLNMLIDREIGVKTMCKYRLFFMIFFRLNNL